MKQLKQLARFKAGDMVLIYLTDDQGAVGMELVPAEMEGEICSERRYRLDPMVQLMARGDDFPDGFINGLSMRCAPASYNLHFKGQQKQDTEAGWRVETVLEDERGLRAVHRVDYCTGDEGVKVFTRLENAGTSPVTLMMLTSFSLQGITPFAPDEATGRLNVYRLRSKWSNEGRLEKRSAEELQLEPTWSKYAPRSEKFGQCGSMPVRGYFPLVGVEDQQSGVCWAAKLGCASSWQMEIYRRDDALSLSGGLADEDFGHWSKTLKPGEGLDAPCAYLSVARGNFDQVSQRLSRLNAKERPAREKPLGMPVVFNEYCTTWGLPSAENIEKILSTIGNKGYDYFVIDAGWYADPVKGWGANPGDWELSQDLFPEGLQKTVDAIRAHGLKPGIWFEMEVCGKDAKAFQMEDHLLKRYGKCITVGVRRFWDMRDPWTVDYLTERVIGFLNRYGFEYIKVDYNDSIGMGVDGDESLGEGLRQSVLASQAFFRRIRERVPNVVIENCSSGGHRIEPSMMALADLASFSDAHEEKEIPVIAANLHRVILPAQSGIWAVLRSEDPDKRLAYSVAATFLGTPCLSGDIYDLNAHQWALVDEGVAFYRQASEIIEKGESTFYGPELGSYRKLEGWQGVLRRGEDGRTLLVLHTFGGMTGQEISIPVGQDYSIKAVYPSVRGGVGLEDGRLKIDRTEEFEGIGVILEQI